MSEHTPTPWVCDIRTGCAAIYAPSPDAYEWRCLSGAEQRAIVYQAGRGAPWNGTDGYRVVTKEQSADLAFIVRCVNSHDALLAACKAALTQLTDLDDVLNQPNLSVVGWHLNGDHEPCVNFFAENDHGAIEKLKAAIAADAEGSGT